MERSAYRHNIHALGRKKQRAHPQRSSVVSTRERPTPPREADRLNFRDVVVLASLIAALVATAILLDPRAHASFDAPKRFAALAGAAFAFLAAFAFPRPSLPLRERWRALPTAARVALLAAVAATLWSGVSCLLSPRRAASADALRSMTLLLLLLPVGASRAVGRGRKVLVTVFLAVTALNAAVSLLQSRGVELLRLETFGTRNETGAFAGNVGYLTLTVAFASVVATGVVLGARRKAVRSAALLLLLILLATLLTNGNLTALVSVLAGTTALFVARFGRRSLLAIAAAGLVLLGAALAIAPLRDRTVDAARAVEAGDWDRLTTYRTGAWAAAIEMARARPIAGWGPGTYAAEFVPHRLAAELRAHRRFVNPLVTSSYSEAHCDYLQAFAEGGVPAGFAVLLATGAILVAVGQTARGSGGSRLEAAVLFGLLVAGAAAALTWFPLQRPITAVPLLIAAGRGWRLAAGWPDGPISR